MLARIEKERRDAVLKSTSVIKNLTLLCLGFSLICCNRLDDTKKADTNPAGDTDTNTVAHSATDTPADSVTDSVTESVQETESWSDNCGTDGCEPEDCIEGICYHHDNCGTDRCAPEDCINSICYNNTCDTDTCAPEDCITASNGTRYCQQTPSTDSVTDSVTDFPEDTDPWQWSTDNCGTDACDPAQCIDGICQR